MASSGKVERTGSAGIREEGGRRWFWLRLNWCPVQKKSRMHAKFNEKLGRPIFFADKRVVEDTKAVRAIVDAAKARETDMQCFWNERWEVRIVVYRPMSKLESKRGTWNRRRGDLCSAHELVMDALSGHFWSDDSQVTKLVLEEERNCVAPGLFLEAAVR